MISEVVEVPDNQVRAYNAILNMSGISCAMRVVKYSFGVVRLCFGVIDIIIVLIHFSPVIFVVDMCWLVLGILPYSG